MLLTFIIVENRVKGIKNIGAKIHAKEPASISLLSPLFFYRILW